MEDNCAKCGKLITRKQHMIQHMPVKNTKLKLKNYHKSHEPDVPAEWERWDTTGNQLSQLFGPMF